MDKKKVAESKESIISTFDRSATTYDRTGPRYFSHFGRRLVELAGLMPGEKVLDVATGRGAVLIPAAQQVGPNGWVTGIDLSAAMVREAMSDLRSIGLTNVDIRQMDAEALEFPEASFDWVLSGFSLWFFPQPGRALSEFLRVLRPGGRFGITTWDSSSQFPRGFLQLIRQHMRSQQDQGAAPQRFDTSAELVSALQGAGFSEIDVRVDEADLVYENEEVLWSTLGAAGLRRYIDQVGPAEKEKLKSEVFNAVRPATRSDGVHVQFRVLATFGSKP